MNHSPNIPEISEPSVVLGMSTARRKDEAPIIPEEK